MFLLLFLRVGQKSGHDAEKWQIGAGIENDDQYFGIPFWGADSKEFFIAREPRIQNTLELYSVSAIDGSKKHIYTEVYISLPAGHNGRAGLDQIYKHLNRKELEDFKAWLRYLCDK